MARPDPEDDFDEWVIGERGLAGALERVAADPAAAGTVEIAATEGLWWCAALDEWHRDRLGAGRYEAI